MLVVGSASSQYYSASSQHYNGLAALYLLLQAPMHGTDVCSQLGHVPSNEATAGAGEGAAALGS